jgi:hypothetical protein
MADVSRIDIRDEIEWQQLRAVLEEREIPHYVRSYHDSAYDGLFQLQLGWGYVETPARYGSEVNRLLTSLRDHRSALPDGRGPDSN